MERYGALWHGAPMAQRSATSGGIFIAIGVLAGFAIGVAVRQPTIGVLTGTAIGIIAALLWWLVRR